jgi:antitoxin component YwqK of YwqJK toxin-antitoxin module
MSEKKNGLVTEYSECGGIKTEVNYVDGKKEGLETESDSTGLHKIAERNYVNDNLHGLSTFWDLEGCKIADVNYVDGELEGAATGWNKDGSIMRVTNYKNGVKIDE